MLSTRWQSIQIITVTLPTTLALGILSFLDLKIEDDLDFL